MTYHKVYTLYSQCPDQEIEQDQHYRILSYGPYPEVTIKLVRP